MTLTWRLRLLSKRRDQVGPALRGLQTSSSLAADVVDGAQAQVSRFTLLGVAEEVRDRIRLQGVGRRPFQRDVPIERIDAMSHHTAATRRQSGPYDVQLALDLARERLDELGQPR
jgi:hypothetical protein